MFKLSIILPLVLILSLLSDLYVDRRFITKRIFHWLFLLKTILLQVMIVLVFLSIGTKHILIAHNNVLWMIISYLIYYIPQIVFSILSSLDFLFRRQRKIATIPALVIALCLFTTILYGITIGRSVARIENVEVELKRLPKSFDGYKIVQLSDLHIGNFGKESSIVKNIVKKVNEQEADLIFLTGDLVNLSADELSSYQEILSSLKAKEGVFSVLGNHDYGDYVSWNCPEEKRANLANLVKTEQGYGWFLLNNDSKIIRHGNDSIAIVGVENWGLPPFPQYGNLSKALERVDSSMFKLLLSHNPTHWDAEIVGKSNVDMMFSGHTHAMQMKVTIGKKSYSPSSRIYRQWSGLYNQGDQYLYVNDGIGYVGMPMRIGTRPEITLLTLRTKK